jgi:hypothetical protein
VAKKDYPILVKRDSLKLHFNIISGLPLLPSSFWGVLFICVIRKFDPKR